MSAYKQLNSQDVIVSPLEVNKGFYFVGGDALTGSNNQIPRYVGRSGNYSESSSLMTGTISSSMLPAVLVYDSIKQLYYGNYISGSGGFIGEAATSNVLLGANADSGVRRGKIETTNFYDYPKTTLWPTRDFPTASAATASVPIGVISIPSKLFGDYIQPQSFKIEHDVSGSIGDDGEGRLYYNGPNESNIPVQFMMGNIIYDHGIVTLFDARLVGASTDNLYGSASYGDDTYGDDAPTTELFINSFITSSQVTMSFSSSYKLFETQYQCTINESEFNYSLNPTIITGSEIPVQISGGLSYSPTASYGQVLDFATGSYFEPYISTVGLYDDDFQLLAVGKLAKPLQSSTTTDTTILVNIDR